MPLTAPETRSAVAQIEQAFSQLLHDHSFAFVISNPREPDCPIVYASAGFFSLTQYTPAEVLGRNCRFLQGPETSHAKVLEIRDAIREDRSCSVVLLNYKKDGTQFWNSFHLAPIRCPETGCVQYYVGLQADVSGLMERGGLGCVAEVAHEEEEHAEEISAQLTAHRPEWEGCTAAGRCAADGSVPSSLLVALAQIQDCFVLSDPGLQDCPIVYASPSFLAMSGYTCGEVLGRNCRFLQGPGTDPEAVRQLHEALSASPPRPVTITLLNYRKSGEPFWNCLHVAPVRDADGRVQFLAGVQLDVTAAQAPSDGTVPAAAAGEAGAVGAQPQGPAAEAGSAAVPEPSPWLLLKQKGVVGAVRVAARALAQHGLRREPAFQRELSASSE